MIRVIYPGDKVRIKEYSSTPPNWNDEGRMDHYMGKIVTVKRVLKSGGGFYIVEDEEEYPWLFAIEDIEEVIYSKVNMINYS